MPLQFILLFVLACHSNASLRKTDRKLLSPRASAGAVAGVSEAGIASILQSIDPTLEQAIGNLHIPDYEKKHIHLTNMRTQGFKCDNPCIYTKMNNGGNLQVAINSFELGFHVRYKVKEIITLQGACDMKIKHSSAKASVSASASDGKIHLGDVQAGINLGDLDTGCHGITGSIINLLSNLFRSEITSTIKNAGDSALKNVIKNSLGKALSGLTWNIPFNDGVEANFSPMAVVSTSASFSLEAAGIVQVANEYATQLSLPTLPSSDLALPAWDNSVNRYLQLMVSSYTFETAGSTYYHLNRLTKVLTEKNVPELNTQFMQLVAPGLKAKFGASKLPMELIIKLGSPPTMVMSEKSGMLVTGDVLLEFTVKQNSSSTEDSSIATKMARWLGLVSNDGMAFELKTTADIEVTFDVTGGQKQILQGKIKNLNLGNWTVASTNVGEIFLLDSLLDLVSTIIQNYAVPFANSILSKGMPLPSADNLKLKNTVIAPKNGYLLVASDFDFSL
jgi:hypothetical protein